MKGSEKQKSFARDIMDAIESAEMPSEDTDDRPKAKISLDQQMIERDQAAIRLIRSADDGTTVAELQEQMEEAGNDAAQILLSCRPSGASMSLEPDDTLTMDAGQIIDTFKGRYYKAYGPDGRL